MLKKLLLYNMEDLALYAGLEGGLFLLVHLIIIAVLYFAKETSCFLFSGIVMPAAAALAVLIAGTAQVGVNFDLALRFGQTRRRALAQSLWVTAVHGAFAMALAALLAWLERLLAPGLWVALTGSKGALINYAGSWSAEPGYLFIESFSLAWWWYPLLLAAGMAAGVILGAVMQRFGGKGLWVIWTAIMLCNLFPALGQVVPGGNHLVHLAAAGVVLAAGLAWSLWSLLCATVKS